jgi:hypothetical protein
VPYDVAIFFKNGSKATFEAQEFDVDLSSEAVDEKYNAIQRFTYKDGRGNDTPLYLVLPEIAGIAVAWKSDTHTTSLRVH